MTKKNEATKKPENVKTEAVKKPEVLYRENASVYNKTPVTIYGKDGTTIKRIDCTLLDKVSHSSALIRTYYSDGSTETAEKESALKVYLDDFPENARKEISRQVKNLALRIDKEFLKAPKNSDGLPSLPSRKTRESYKKDVQSVIDAMTHCIGCKDISIVSKDIEILFKYAVKESPDYLGEVTKASSYFLGACFGIIRRYYMNVEFSHIAKASVLKAIEKEAEAKEAKRQSNGAKTKKPTKAKKAETPKPEKTEEAA